MLFAEVAYGSRTADRILRHAVYQGLRADKVAEIKAQIASGTYNPSDPMVIPVREDKQYRSWKEVKQPQAVAVIVYMMDVSGSMTDEQKEIVRIEAFWIDTWIKAHYQGVETVYIIHDAAAQEVVKRKPALVVWITSLYASVFDIWAKAGIPSIGGSSFDENFYVGRRPFRYDVGMDGTEAADHIAEYYCKNMAKKNASHSGRVIHPQIGPRDQVPRRIGRSSSTNEATDRPRVTATRRASRASPFTPRVSLVGRATSR